MFTLETLPPSWLRFTTHEDDLLKKGIDKHGFGQWTAIFRDPDFGFQKGRLADSLKKRAELRFLPKGTVLAERLETRGKEFEWSLRICSKGPC